MVEKQLGTEQKAIMVWLNARRYEKEQLPIVPRVATIVREMKPRKSLLAKIAGGAAEPVRVLRAVAYGFSAKSAVDVPRVRLRNGLMATLREPIEAAHVF